MRLLMTIVVATLTAPAVAAPPDAVSPMTLPGQAGYMQPGNPDRGISMVGRESAMVRQRTSSRVTCASLRGRETRCRIGSGKAQLIHHISGRCREGRDWFQTGRAVVVTHSCRAVFGTRR